MSTDIIRIREANIFFGIDTKKIRRTIFIFNSDLTVSAAENNRWEFNLTDFCKTKDMLITV